MWGIPANTVGLSESPGAQYLVPACLSVAPYSLIWAAPGLAEVHDSDFRKAQGNKSLLPDDSHAFYCAIATHSFLAPEPENAEMLYRAGTAACAGRWSLARCSSQSTGGSTARSKSVMCSGKVSSRMAWTMSGASKVRLTIRLT